MNRWMSLTIALCAVMGCSSSRPTETAARVSSPEEFAGSWRSVTPSLEFIRLSVQSLSIEQGAFGARLTLSGVAWEGSGRIAGDSLVTNMAISGSTQASAVMVARSPGRDTLAVVMRSAGGTPFALTLVRE